MEGAADPCEMEIDTDKMSADLSNSNMEVDVDIAETEKELSEITTSVSQEDKPKDGDKPQPDRDDPVKELSKDDIDDDELLKSDEEDSANQIDEIQNIEELLKSDEEEDSTCKTDKLAESQKSPCPDKNKLSNDPNELGNIEELLKSDEEKDSVSKTDKLAESPKSPRPNDKNKSSNPDELGKSDDEDDSTKNTKKLKLDESCKSDEDNFVLKMSESEEEDQNEDSSEKKTESKTEMIQENRSPKIDIAEEKEKNEESHKSDEDEIENIDSLGLLTETADQVGHVSDDEDQVNAHDDDDEEEEYDDDENQSPGRGEEPDDNDTDYVPDAGEESSQSADDHIMESCDEGSRDQSHFDALLGGGMEDIQVELHYSSNKDGIFDEKSENCMSISNITSLGTAVQEDASLDQETSAETPQNDDLENETLSTTDHLSSIQIAIVEEVSSTKKTESVSDITADSNVETALNDPNSASPESTNVDVEMKDVKTPSSDDKAEETVGITPSDIQTIDKEKPMSEVDNSATKPESLDDSNKVFKDVMDGVHKLLQSNFFASEQEKKKLEEFEKTFLNLQTGISGSEKNTSGLSINDEEILKEADACLEDKEVNKILMSTLTDNIVDLEPVQRCEKQKDSKTEKSNDSNILEKSEEKIETVKTNVEKSHDIIPSIEILSLDSDDDEPKTPQNTKKKATTKKAKCVNIWCESDDTVSIMQCPNFMLSLYNFKFKKNITARPTICNICFQKAINHAEVITAKLRSSRSIFHPGFVKADNQVEILDSDSDEEAENEKDIAYINRFNEIPLNETERSFIIDNLFNVATETWTKFDLNRVIVNCMTDLKKHILSTKNTGDQFVQEVQNLQKQTDDVRTSFYELFKVETSETIPLIIMPESENQILIPNEPETYDTQMLPEVPPNGPVEDITMKVGDVVYAMKMSVFGAWAKAHVLEVWPKKTPLANGNASTFSMLKIKFELTERETSDTIKQVTGRQVAFSTPSNVRYKVGSRVVALFKNLDLKIGKKQSYYAGIVAEPPLVANDNRYLIFFDDGYSQYVPHCDTLRLYEWSQNVWEDVHPNSRDFIKKYLFSYPDRPLVKLNVAQTLKVSFNGKWCNAKVLEVDATLALLAIIELKPSIQIHQQWIYRGSTRLHPLYQELNVVEKPDKRTHTRQRQHNANKNGVPYVEYTRTTDDCVTQQPTEPVQKLTRSVAKKSTTTIKNENIQNVTPPKTTIEMTESNSKSRVVYYSPKTALKPRIMTPHICGPICADQRAMPLSKLKGYNPLARPLLNGWERLIMRFKSKRAIIYRTPCGRCVRSPKELHQYLLLIKSDMSVDLFDFDPWVHCLAEFHHAKCLVTKRDISHGVEAVPIPCVNSYDSSLPEFSAYSTRRIPTEGVHLNLDEEFLCGCDCTDDCQDRNKCQCWQLTLEGAKLLRMDPETVGYQYKRLLDNVATGIYECNSRCKCAMTCLNRVVQHPLQHKLQVFKTLNRGWGIRTLNDLPKGAFICVYAGNLLTDAVANVDGINEGDEYLAELDYIEVVEKIKESYEADIPDADKLLDEEDDDLQSIKDEPDDVDDDDTVEPDHDFRPDCHIPTGSTDKEITTRLRTKIKKRKGEKTNDNVAGDSITISDDEEDSAVRQPSSFAAPEDINDDEDDYIPKYKSVRFFFGEDEACYIMDAKVKGNIGRYLNHSCSPNVFVQNVLVDTHDPRFPWVSFFSLNHIRAGTELTWNYNYEVGSVSGKVLYCRCGAPNCRGRLL